MPLYVPSEETARRVLTSSMGYMIAWHSRHSDIVRVVCQCTAPLQVLLLCTQARLQ